MTGNVHEAEDLAQDTFIQLHRKLDTFRGDSEFTTWLHRLTVNVVLMYFRKPGRQRELLTINGEMPEMYDSASIDNDRMQPVDYVALDRAIDQLPNGYRTVMLLHDVEGYEHEEIGAVLGISVGTSKSQLHKARNKMRRLLETGR